MIFKELKPRKALNKAFLKVKPNRTDIEIFKTNLITLLDRINDTESEEFHKNLVSDFLKKTYYDPNHFINTKGRNDLVIHIGNEKSNVGVIIEAKKPTNKTEMITPKKLNVKAFQELVLYYLRERITHKNLEIKHLVATNINEWYIFDATVFDRLFAQDKKFVRQFNDFEGLRLVDNRTDFFYKSVAEPFIASIDTEIEFTYFNLQDFQMTVRNKDKTDDNALIALFKVLSPEHLLKLPFTNDSNSLDKCFYNELLHIIGLSESKNGSKRVIGRNDKELNSGTILEGAIVQLDTRDKIGRLEKPNQFGNSNEDRLFNVALELTITWINRILFLKLLEAQLIAYHKGDKSYSFLNIEKIKSYDDLDTLFFQVLAQPLNKRDDNVKKTFDKVPYLNSSLFEQTEIEHTALVMSNLKNDQSIPIFSQTVLKDQRGKILSGQKNTLEYLLDFLDAYDFSSEGSEVIQEENKSLINASVLGLIFEKINGYKEGSFFTPGFITMYMCRKTIRKAVLQKFNEVKKWNCVSVEELYNKIDDIKEANKIVNSVKICDPAVGSGHFLVSALNEIIAVKNDLKILQDRNGKRLKEYYVEVVNDELIVTDEDGELFEYNPTSKESQRIQETLFHEKETIIENCLFGVDINSNSVKICRLRLWIELLKNAYYKNEKELETLPNIDINIQCGNSLISRFATDADIKQVFKRGNIRTGIKEYRDAFATYRQAKSKEEKRKMELLIKNIKQDFQLEIDTPFKKKIRAARTKITALSTEINTQEQWGKVDKALVKELANAKANFKKIEIEKINIETNKIYENAFEWRFEFPEVLDDNGDFVGFDVVIGNPPYGTTLISEDQKKYIKEKYEVVEGAYEIYKLFVENGLRLLKGNGLLCFISPDTWTNLSYFSKLRLLIVKNNLLFCTSTLYNVFDEATVNTNIYLIEKSDYSGHFNIVSEKLESVGLGIIDDLSKPIISLKVKPELIEKIETNTEKLSEFIDVWRGMSAYGAADPQRPFNSKEKETDFHRPLLNGGDIERFHINFNGEFIKYGNWLHRPRPSYIYERPHLLVQRIRNPKLQQRIVATIDTDKYISSDGLSNLVLRDENQSVDLLKYILGIINSSIINYWFSFYYFDVNIKPEQLREIPIKNVSDIQPYVFLVDYILFLKNLKKDTNFFERLLDTIVYELYLNEELNKGGVEVLKHLGNLPKLIDDQEGIKTIEKLQRELSDPKHPISTAMLRLLTIEEINIIEKRV